MPRALHELREGRDRKRAKARVGLQQASRKMALELGLEQSFLRGVGRTYRQTVTGRHREVSTLNFGGHGSRFGVRAGHRMGQHSTVTCDGGWSAKPRTAELGTGVFYEDNY